MTTFFPIFILIDIKYIDSLDRNDPQPVGTKDEWLAEFNRPDEELYEGASIADAKVGQLVSFGEYEQNADDSDGTEDILCIVTEENGDTLTLMSLYCLDVVPYSLENTDTTWETSYLREFLNNDFYDSAFSIGEKNMIVDSEVINNDNPVHGTFGGNNTTDKVYIMSIEEAMEFYSVAEPVEMFYDRIHAQATEYAIQKGVWLEIPDSSRCWWWLRSPGGSASQAAEIGSAGYCSFNGSFVDSTERALRPVIKINR